MRPVDAAPWLSLLLLAACDGSLTQIVVVVESDLVVPAELDAVAVDASGQRSGGALETPSDLPATVTLHRTGSIGRFEVKATGSLDGREVVKRTALLSFVPGQSRALVLELLRECAGVDCGPDTCVRGACVAPDVDATTLPRWTGRPAPFDAGAPRDGGAPEPGFAEETVVELAAGARHTCARVASGRVFCWGGNDHGQLGRAGPGQSTRPVAVPGIEDATAVAAGGDASCAATMAGPLRCWGDNDRGQLATGDTATVVGPARAQIDGPAAFGLGDAHGCAIAGGRVRCWGDNDRAQLAAPPGAAEPSPRAIDGLAPGAAAVLAVGAAGACALDDAGALRCWGDNDAAQAGAAPSGPVSTPTAIGGLDTPTSVALGARHGCAVVVGRSVRCWGDGSRGQLGDGRPGPRASADLVVLEPPDADRVAAGAHHTCAMRLDGRVSCWGDNERGQVGDGSTDRTVELPRDVGLGDVTGLSAGAAHTCAVRMGAAHCWGDNARGQLGDGTTVGRSTPARVGGGS